MDNAYIFFFRDGEFETNKAMSKKTVCTASGAKIINFCEKGSIFEEVIILVKESVVYKQMHDF